MSRAWYVSAIWQGKRIQMHDNGEVNVQSSMRFHVLQGLSLQGSGQEILHMHGTHADAPGWGGSRRRRIHTWQDA